MSADSVHRVQTQDAAEKAIEEIVAAIEQEFFAPAAEAEAYHYTRIDTALKILSSDTSPYVRPDHARRKLWFADAYTMNDTAEIAHGEALFERAIRLGIGSRQPAYEPLYKRASSLRANYFVLSMSKLQDSLSMWRAYGGDGEGIALRIALKALQRHNAPEAWPGYSVACCLYRRQEEPESRLTSLVSTAVDRLDDAGIKFFLNNLDMRLGIFLPYLKNSAYEEEQEIRAVYSVIHGGPTVFCVGHPPRQFIELEFEDSMNDQLFVGATIGPSLNALFHKRAVENLIMKTGASGQAMFPPVRISSIPYRGRAGA